MYAKILLQCYKGEKWKLFRQLEKCRQILEKWETTAPKLQNTVLQFEGDTTLNTYMNLNSFYAFPNFIISSTTERATRLQMKTTQNCPKDNPLK